MEASLPALGATLKDRCSDEKATVRRTGRHNILSCGALHITLTLKFHDSLRESRHWVFDNATLGG